MNWLKKNKLLLLFLAIIYLSYFLFQYKPQQPIRNVLGIKSNVSLIIEPEDERTLLDAIYNATREIHVVVYLLSDKDLIDALIAKDAEGIDVRVMLEEHTYGGQGLNKKSRKVLEEGGVEVEWANPSYALTHQKTIIIDDAEVFIMNQNLTASAFDKNREFNIINYNLQYVTEIEKMFEADWQRKSFTPQFSALIISPYNSRSKLTSLLMSADRSIEVEMEILQDPEMGKILSEKAKVVDVRVIIPEMKKIPSNYKMARRLKASGVKVKELSSPYLHAKLIIIDDIKSYVGSINFSTQSLDKNRELGIIIENQEVLDKLNASFDLDWQNSQVVN